MALKMQKKKIDMCNGPLGSAMMRFALPLMATALLQQMYNAADMAVVGRYAGGEALAAVGATATLCVLVRTWITGMSVGTSVLVANAVGSGKRDKVGLVVHTSLALSLLMGLVFGVVGYLLCEQMLLWTGTPQNVYDQAVVYMRIYFVSVPFISLYNFAATPIRAIGDSRTPMLILMFSGMVNVLLNLYTVIVLNMGVAGVAWATFASQALSAIMALIYLLRTKESIHVSLTKIRFHGKTLSELLRVGVPSAVQSALFSLSNVLIQTGVNSFGSDAVAGSSTGTNVEVMAFLVVDAIGQAATIFAGQNMGAKKYKRLPQVLGMSLMLSIGICAVLTVGGCVFRRELIGLFTTVPAIIEYGATKLWILLSCYTLVCFMNITAGYLRGCGYSMMPTIVSLIGVCGLRVVWMYTAFVWFPSYATLMWCYPFTWLVTGVANVVCYFLVCRKKLMRLEEAQA